MDIENYKEGEIFLDIKFELTISLENLVTNKIDEITKTITKKNVQLLEDGVSTELYSSNILEYFARDLKIYCVKNEISEDSIVLDGYEIKSLTDNVNVFFNSEDVKEFSMTPKIMAVYKYKEKSPLLKCDQINETTARWKWNSSDTLAYYLVDGSTNTVIVQLPIGTDYYIETGLKPNEIYFRYIIGYNDKVENLKSNLASITLIANKEASTYTSFKVQKRIEKLSQVNLSTSEKMEAFQSGIGDFDDCKLFKPNTADYKKVFKLINKVYGIRASDVIRHNTIKFKYRYQLRAKTDYLGYGGKVKVKVTAIEIQPIDEKIMGEPLQNAEPIVGEELIYEFDDNTNVADIFLYNQVPAININNYSKRFRFDIEITALEGSTKIYSYRKGQRTLLQEKLEENNYVTFSEYGFYDHKISITALPIKKQKDYIETFPTYDKDPLVGAINGDFTLNEDGIKDYNTKVVTFDTQVDVYDKKYYCLIEKITPDTAYIQYDFGHPVEDEDYTITNNDDIRFYSDAFIADDTEYTDFIAEADIGDYIITDNRKHEYSYRLDNITLPSEKYKRYELVVVGSINDIVILDYPKDLVVENNVIVNDIDVVLRTVQNAIGKWSPWIHNGYYYLNQEEHFLYSRCSINGEGAVATNGVFYTPNIFVKVIVRVKNAKTEDKIYNFQKKTKKELLIKKDNFYYENGMVFPKPLEPHTDYYADYLDEYVYETAPFTFEREPNKIDYINWEQYAQNGNTVDCYYISYDEVYGAWNSPVKIPYGTKRFNNLDVSRIVKLKFILRPSKRARIKDRVLLYSCESAWKNNINTFLSKNCYYTEECLMPLSLNTTGMYISMPIDLGDSSITTEKRYIIPNITYSGDVQVYFQDASDKTAFENYYKGYQWTIVPNGHKVEVRRYVRFKIVMKRNSIVRYFELRVGRFEYTGMKIQDIVPAIGNIQFGATYIGEETTRKYESIVSTALPFDMTKHRIIENLYEYIYDLSMANEFKMNEVSSVSFAKLGSNIEYYNVLYNGNSEDVLNEPVYAQSIYKKENEYMLDKNFDGILFTLKEGESLQISPIPQQYSPIIIKEENTNIYYRQVFFLDNDFKYTLTNTETFESLGFTTLYLQEYNIDLSTIQIRVDNVIVNNYTITNNVVTFMNKIEKGKIIQVKYKVKNSFIALYDYEKDMVEITFHKEKDAYPTQVRIFYETNKMSSLRELDYLSLNPIYNARYNGYIFLSDVTLNPFKIEIIAEDNYIFANGKDSMNVFIKVTDKYDNPVENARVNIACALGKIEKVNDVTDINGIIQCTYTSWTGSCVDKIKAIINNRIKNEIIIYNRKL